MIEQEAANSQLSIEWTNPSVLKLAGGSNPVQVISEMARNLVRRALEEGWQGPPFDPFWLAEYLRIPVNPSYDVMDARVVSPSRHTLEIEYNPNQVRNRIRFSLAHEIAHTLFPDCAEEIRNRSANARRQDTWQLELLCNIAAAQILMPVGPEEFKEPISIETVMSLSRTFDVSTEAALLRTVRLTEQPVCVFVAAMEGNQSYRIDYTVSSPTFAGKIPSGMRIHRPSVLFECTAIGYTAKGRERWGPSFPEFYVECIGIPAYPGDPLPRVAGIARIKDGEEKDRAGIVFLQGNALEQRGDGFKIIAHIVNDATPNWGAGFGLELSKKLPSAMRDFKAWVEMDRKNLTLGKSHLSLLSDDLAVFHMVAQHGYGKSSKPLIRYSALEECLRVLAKTAREKSGSVHMPRIGTGFAGGSWGVIKELIEESLVEQGIKVTVYTLPGSRRLGSLVQSLNEFATS